MTAQFYAKKLNLACSYYLGIIFFYVNNKINGEKSTNQMERALGFILSLKKGYKKA
jgi:hypothetical protein